MTKDSPVARGACMAAACLLFTALPVSAQTAPWNKTFAQACQLVAVGDTQAVPYSCAATDHVSVAFGGTFTDSTDFATRSDWHVDEVGPDSMVVSYSPNVSVVTGGRSIGIGAQAFIVPADGYRVDVNSITLYGTVTLTGNAGLYTLKPSKISGEEGTTKTVDFEDVFIGSVIERPDPDRPMYAIIGTSGSIAPFWYSTGVGDRASIDASFNKVVYRVSVSLVPEASTLSMMALGLLAMAGLARQRRRG